MRMTLGWPSLGAVALVTLATLGCGGSSEPGSGGSGGPAELDASKVFRGNLSLTGTISLPKGAGAGKAIQLTVSGGGADITTRGSFVGQAGTSPGDTVPYGIRGLVAGEYSVRARIDSNSDGDLTTPGDLDGYTGGTVEAPIQDSAQAKTVTVSASGATGVDFGVAPIRR